MDERVAVVSPSSNQLTQLIAELRTLLRAYLQDYPDARVCLCCNADVDRETFSRAYSEPFLNDLFLHKVEVDRLADCQLWYYFDNPRSDRLDGNYAKRSADCARAVDSAFETACQIIACDSDIVALKDQTAGHLDGATRWVLWLYRLAWDQRGVVGFDAPKTSPAPLLDVQSVESLSSLRSPALDPATFLVRAAGLCFQHGLMRSNVKAAERDAVGAQEGSWISVLQTGVFMASLQALNYVEQAVATASRAGYGTKWGQVHKLLDEAGNPTDRDSFVASYNQQWANKSNPDSSTGVVCGRLEKAKLGELVRDRRK